MSSRPFFSVVIPTYRRPHYLFDAIYSVLHQDFRDLECIVSDNCNGPDTQEVIDQFRSDSRLRVVRPQTELNMPDHWEFATKHAEGRWVMVLTDRKLMRQGCMNYVQRQLRHHPSIRIGSYRTRTFNDLKGHLGWTPDPARSGTYTTSTLINAFLNSHISVGDHMDPIFPKSLNGFYLNDYAREVRQSFGSYFNQQGVTAPDFGSFFINCALNDESLHLNLVCLFTQGEHLSQGRTFGKGRFRAYMDSLGIPDPYVHVPIKAPLTSSLLFSDYIITSSRIGNNLANKQVNWTKYFMLNYSELQRKQASDALGPEDKSWFASSFHEALDHAVASGDVDASDRIMHRTQAPVKSRIALRRRVRGYLEYHWSHLAVINGVVKYRFPQALSAAGL